MRHFINSMLAFTLVVFVAGLVPVSARHLDRLQAMKMELAQAQSNAWLVNLRPAYTH